MTVYVSEHGQYRFMNSLNELKVLKYSTTKIFLPTLIKILIMHPIKYYKRVQIISRVLKAYNLISRRKY